VILKGNPEIEIPKIVQEYKAQKVFAKREVAYEEKITEQLVEKELWKLNCELKTFSSSTLYHAEDLPFSIKDIPDVFTSFRKKIEKESTIRTIFDSPIKIKSPILPDFKLPSLEKLGINQAIKSDSRAAIQFKGGETEALKRINNYFFETKAISQYKETRNGMIGENYSSKLSAWLALGCVSPRKIYSELKKYESLYEANESTYWLVFELLWRDYFRFVMKKYNHKLFMQTGIQDKVTPSNKNKTQLESWINGTTGVDFVDANMLELKLTGFMSNRGRQNVASYLCNDLKLDWRYGAAYFEQQLIDYDVCSNWGNWAYLAGVGNDPRGNRYFNIEKQASDYDKNKAFRKLWLKK
jgi:deoxyribodipyrimidine photo-lyase